jgi:hypothetical protein
MKFIQVIDNAENCAYSIYAVDDNTFEIIFPHGQDIEFIDDFQSRIGVEKSLELLTPVWKKKVDKKNINGLHGILFYQLEFKKKYYPSKKETEMNNGL